MQVGRDLGTKRKRAGNLIILLCTNDHFKTVLQEKYSSLFPHDRLGLLLVAKAEGMNRIRMLITNMKEDIVRREKRPLAVANKSCQLIFPEI